MLSEEMRERLESVQETALDHFFEEMSETQKLTIATKEDRGDRYWLTKMAKQSMSVAAAIEQFLILKARTGGISVTSNTDPDKEAERFARKAQQSLEKRGANVAEFRKRIGTK